MSDATRILAERNVLPAAGPRFYREDGKVMFVFIIDTANTIGPRPANRADQAKHPGAWQAFCAAEGVSSLDRDATDGVGGSLPAESPREPVVEAVTPPPRKPRRKKG